MPEDCHSEEKQFVQRTYGPSGLNAFFNGVAAAIEAPATWFRETIVAPNRKEYPWYHEKFPRVKDIDQCYTDDPVCIYEAQEQFKRDMNVDANILNILRYRVEDCFREEYPDHVPRCRQLEEDYNHAAGNWFSRYGDLGAQFTVVEAFMKQKHRMLWERRHGPIGTGMKIDPYHVEPEEH